MRSDPEPTVNSRKPSKPSDAKTSETKTPRTLVIAGGGTGGHIYPGVAIARAVERLHPELQVHFVGAEGGLEEKIIPREKFPLHTVPVGRLHHTVGLVTRLKTLFTLPLSFWRAYRILKTLDPVAVLGVGGFASGPMLFVASLAGYRTLIWEPNAYPGLTNRWLAGRVNECLLVFDEAAHHLHARKTTHAGLPVRATMLPAPVRTSETRPLRILVFGGSQGARFINNLVSECVMQGGDWLRGIEIVHQTGPADFQRIQEAYRSARGDVSGGAPENVQVFEYLHDMDARYRWADLVVCRSGASTVAEIAACEKAAIFIPLPTAADDHQRKNAEVLAKAGAALMFQQKDVSAQIFRETIVRFRDDRSLIGQFEQNVRRFQFPFAAEKIVERLLAHD